MQAVVGASSAGRVPRTCRQGSVAQGDPQGELGNFERSWECILHGHGWTWQLIATAHVDVPGHEFHEFPVAGTIGRWCSVCSVCQRKCPDAVSVQGCEWVGSSTMAPGDGTCPVLCCVMAHDQTQSVSSFQD